MTVDLDVPAGTETEFAARVAALDDVTLAGLDPDDRDRYLAIARLFLDLIADGDYHWGCTSAEGAETEADEAYGDGYEDGFDRAKERILDGLTRLQEASMVEAEAVVVLAPKIRAMTAIRPPARSSSSETTKTPQEQA